MCHRWARCDQSWQYGVWTTYHQAIDSAGPIDNHYMEALDIYFPTDLYIDMYTIYVYIPGSSRFVTFSKLYTLGRYVYIVYVYIYIKQQYTKAYMFIRNPIPVDKHKNPYKQKWWSSPADIFAGFLNHQRPWKKIVRAPEFFSIADRDDDSPPTSRLDDLNLGMTSVGFFRPW